MSVRLKDSQKIFLLFVSTNNKFKEHARIQYVLSLYRMFFMRKEEQKNVLLYKVASGLKVKGSKSTYCNHCVQRALMTKAIWKNEVCKHKKETMEFLFLVHRFHFVGAWATYRIYTPPSLKRKILNVEMSEMPRFMKNKCESCHFQLKME